MTDSNLHKQVFPRDRNNNQGWRHSLTTWQKSMSSLERMLMLEFPAVYHQVKLRKKRMFATSFGQQYE